MMMLTLAWKPWMMTLTFSLGALADDADVGPGITLADNADQINCLNIVNIGYSTHSTPAKMTTGAFG